MEPPLDDQTLADPMEVTVGGRTLSAWTSVEVDRPLDAATGSFRLSINLDASRGLPVKPYQEIEIQVEGELLLTGYVDAVDSESGKDSRTIIVSGRDTTADLVDSSSLDPALANVTLQKIAETLSTPFGIEVAPRFPAEKDFPSVVFTVSPGETAFAAIERAARLRGLLVFTRGDGRLAIEAPAQGVADVPLEEGRAGNVLKSRLSYSNANRFQTYIVRGQSPGTDFASGAFVAGVEGRGGDLQVDRYRPLVILAPASVTESEAIELAKWEATVRAARSSKLVVEVAGWRQSLTARPGLTPGTSKSARLWAVNELVRVLVPTQEIEGRMLVNRARFRRSRKTGTKTSLELIREDAYETKPSVTTEEDPFGSLLTDQPLGG